MANENHHDRSLQKVPYPPCPPWNPRIANTSPPRYHLKQPDLFTAGIRYGQYYGVTGLTTLFLEHEVREVATRVHAGPGGDLAMYLALRASQSVKRKAKQEEAREAKKVHLRQVLVANGLPDATLVTKLSPLLFPVHNQRAAMTVLDIVRMQILEYRLDTELGYRQPEHGPSPTSSYVAWEQARVWDTRVVDNMPRTFSYMLGDQSHTLMNPSYKQIRDSRDKALFELFCKEFGLFPEYYRENAPEWEPKLGGEMSKNNLYKVHRHMWTSVSSAKRTLEMPKQAIIAPGRRPRWEATIMEAHAPWSFARYPVLIKDVPVDDLDVGITPNPKKVADKEKERKKIIKWNAGAEKEMSRITALIKDRWLNIECWCKLKKPQYEVEEVEAADALQVLREGGRDVIVLD